MSGQIDCTGTHADSRFIAFFDECSDNVLDILGQDITEVASRLPHAQNEVKVFLNEVDRNYRAVATVEHRSTRANLLGSNSKASRIVDGFRAGAG